MASYRTILQVRLGFPPGTNNVYGFATRTGKDGKARASSYMRESGLTYKQEVMVAVREADPDFAIPPKKSIHLRLKFLCSPKTYNRRDLDGNLKVLMDALFKLGGGDDRYVRELLATKERSAEDAVEVMMAEIVEEV